MKVILHFPSPQLFGLWCKAFAILRDHRSNGTLHFDDKLLGHYAPSKDGGILAVITRRASTS
jgi:hypothetical protein